jgi:hypothetical protein
MATIKIEIDDKQIVTLAASIGVSMLIGLESQLKEHSAIKRKVLALESAISDLARLSGSTIDAEVLEVGIGAWGAAVKYLQKHLKEKTIETDITVKRKPTKKKEC